MRQNKCDNCGEVITIIGKNEEIIDGETPLKHYERTGHLFFETDKIPYTCDDCEYVWMYGGNSEQPSCSNCKGRKTKPLEKVT